MLDQVKKVVLVLSGKGGVGKSTVSTQLTLGLARAGKKVGILDIDLCGPSIGLMFNLDKQDIMCSEKGWEPVEVPHSSQAHPVKVMSIAFLLKDDSSAVIWRGPKKTAMIKQFLNDVNWGELDYLIVDTPPGTSDEHISIAECLRDCKANAEAVVVTTPQMISINDVRRELSFCVKASLPVQGIIENMSGFICPNCAECNNIFSKGGGKSLAEFTELPYLGSIPIEPELANCMDNGENYLTKFDGSECSKSITEIVNKIADQ